jgi:hypothetical protein
MWIPRRERPASRAAVHHMESQPAPREPVWRTAAALAFLLALTALFFWKFTISGQYSWVEASDTAFQVRPWLDFQAREVQAGRLPLWTPYEWGGHSIPGQVITGFSNPLNWILFLVPVRGGHLPLAALNWYWVLIHWLGAVFAYALCRDLGARTAAAFAGATVFALTGYMGHTDWPQMLMSAVWLPLVMLFLARAFRGERPLGSAAWSGAALGLSFLGGHHQIPIYCTVVIGVLWCWLLLRGWRERKTWLMLGAFLAAWLLVSGFQSLPALEYGQRAVRWAGAPEPLRWQDRVPFYVHQQYSAGWRVFGALVLSKVRMDPNPFVGFVALAGALSALTLRRRSLNVRIFGVVTACGLVIALGSHTPFYKLAYLYFPMMEKARTPANAVVLANLGLAALAAMGLEAWAQSRKWMRHAVWLAFALILAEAVNAAPGFTRVDRPDSYWKLMQAHTDIAEFLLHQPGWYRVRMSEDDIPYNFGDFFGVEQYGAYVASMPENTFRVQGSAEAAQLFGIRYRVGKQPVQGETAVFESSSGLRVYENPAIQQPLWVWRKDACAAPDHLRVLARWPGGMDVEADLGCPGQVVTGDAYFKGWAASVDGERAPISEFASAVRAVRVAAGHHRVEYRYPARTVFWGAAASLLGLLFASCISLQEKQRD